MMSGLALHLYKDDPARREARLDLQAQRFARDHNIAAGDLTVQQGEFGKPFFPHAPGLHFSVSHSGEYWLLALSTAELGVDIQQHRSTSWQRLAERNFTAAEYAFVSQRGPEAFFTVWCAREAYLKYLGCGFARPIEFSVVENNALLTRVATARLSYPPAPAGYTICVAVEDSADTVCPKPFLHEE